MKPFSEMINANEPTLVDFSADWCGPCKMMKPVLEELKNRMGNRATILKIDVDRNPAVAESYQIRGVPTLILFKKGKVLWRQSGVVSADILKATIEHYDKEIL